MVMLTRNPKGPQDLGKNWLDCFLSTSYSFFFHFLVCIPLFLCINMQLSMCYCSINNPTETTTHQWFLHICVPSLYGVCLVWSLADSLHSVALEYFWCDTCCCVSFRCDRVLQCHRTRLTPELPQLPFPFPLPRTGNWLPLSAHSVSVLYIIDAHLYPDYKAAL